MIRSLTLLISFFFGLLPAFAGDVWTSSNGVTAVDGFSGGHEVWASADFTTSTFTFDEDAGAGSDVGSFSAIDAKGGKGEAFGSTGSVGLVSGEDFTGYWGDDVSVQNLQFLGSGFSAADNGGSASTYSATSGSLWTVGPYGYDSAYGWIEASTGVVTDKGGAGSASVFGGSSESELDLDLGYFGYHSTSASSNASAEASAEDGATSAAHLRTGIETSNVMTQTSVDVFTSASKGAHAYGSGSSSSGISSGGYSGGKG